MQELRYLTEKDMEYFYKLEEQGEAIILRLEPEQLLSLDLSELDTRKADAGGSINEEEIIEWLKQQGETSELQQKYEENETILQENQQLRDALEGNEKLETDSVQQEVPARNRQPARMKKRKQTLVGRLQEVRLSEEQTEIIDYAIQQGLEEEYLLVLLQDGMTADKMRKLCGRFLDSSSRNE